jgi:hypothetical protein
MTQPPTPEELDELERLEKAFRQVQWGDATFRQKGEAYEDALRRMLYPLIAAARERNELVAFIRRYGGLIASTFEDTCRVDVASQLRELLERFGK